MTTTSHADTTVDAAQPKAPPGASTSIEGSAALDQARVHLAAAHRLAALHALDEGIDNHFTVTVPGRKPSAWICCAYGPSNSCNWWLPPVH
jgi:hypothetical protein